MLLLFFFFFIKKKGQFAVSIFYRPEALMLLLRTHFLFDMRDKNGNSVVGIEKMLKRPKYTSAATGPVCKNVCVCVCKCEKNERKMLPCLPGIRLQQPKSLPISPSLNPPYT